MAAVTPLDPRRTAGFSSDQTLQTRDLSIGYAKQSARRPARVIAAQLNLTLRAGELVCLIGPNGAGKSTLMRTLAGMQSPLRGEIALMGDDLAQLPTREVARRLSIVLTERVNPGLLTAYTLVALGRHPYTDWSGRLTQEDVASVRAAIAAVGAQDLADRQVGELSDGERQKIMIARALAQEPAVLLLDEPTAFLDLPRRVEIMQLLRRLTRDQQRAILLSTHDLDLALRTADRIWLLAGDGSLQAGAPEDLVLSGAFADAFRAEGVAFDPLTGAFRSSERAQKRVSLSGDGLPALWTRRALERAGFSIAAADTTVFARIDVLDQRWHVTIGTAAHDYASLADLVEALKSTTLA